VDAPAVEQVLDQFSRSIEQGVSHVAQGEEPYVEPHQLYLAPQQLEEHLKVKRQIHLADLHIYDLDHDKAVLRVDSCGNGDILEQPEGQRIRHLAHRLALWAEQQWSVLLVCRRAGQAQRLIDLLKPYDVVPEPLTGLPWQEQPGTVRWVCGDISRFSVAG